MIQPTNSPTVGTCFSKTLCTATDRSRDLEALLVYGSTESGKSSKQKYLPHFKRGRIVIHENMGHMDVTALQPEAARHLEKRFFLKGVVDTSMFKKREAADINFVPDQRFGDMAKAFMQQQK